MDHHPDNDPNVTTTFYSLNVIRHANRAAYEIALCVGQQRLTLGRFATMQRAIEVADAMSPPFLECIKSMVNDGDQLTDWTDIAQELYDAINPNIPPV